MEVEKLVAGIGFVFALLAGLAAFLITYEEYARHYPDRRIAFRKSMHMAFVSFAFFFGFTLIAVVFLWLTGQ